MMSASRGRSQLLPEAPAGRRRRGSAGNAGRASPTRSRAGATRDPKKFVLTDPTTGPRDARVAVDPREQGGGCNERAKVGASDVMQDAGHEFQRPAAQAVQLFNQHVDWHAAVVGDVAVLGYLTYLEVWELEKFQQRLLADPYSEEDEAAIARLGI